MTSRRPLAGGLSILLIWLAATSGCGSGERSEPAEPVTSEPPVSSAFDSGLLEQYLIAHDALARDQLYDAQTALGALSAFAAYTDGDLEKNVGEAIWATDIKTARVSFELISEELIKTELPDGYGVAYCPMAFDYKGARWIQAEGDIRNPYYGASMLHCGAFEELAEDPAP